MIYIVFRTKSEKIVGLNIHGHADSAEYGKDLVCAGVSSIAVGMLNALDILGKNNELQMGNNIITVKVNDLSDQISQTILKTAKIQLETMCESHRAFIKINKQEV